MAANLVGKGRGPVAEPTGRDEFLGPIVSSACAKAAIVATASSRLASSPAALC